VADAEEEKERARMAELSLNAFERGIKETKEEEKEEGRRGIGSSCIAPEYYGSTGATLI
jgi:hypothetical protein